MFLQFAYFLYIYIFWSLQEVDMETVIGYEIRFSIQSAKKPASSQNQWDFLLTFFSYMLCLLTVDPTL